MAHLGDVLIDLVAGQLTTFAGLCALRHLDLDVVGIDQVLGRDAKASRRDLLDARAHAVAIRHWHETIGFLAAFARVGTAANAVHRDGQCRVRLAADRAEAHRAGGEAFHDLGGRLDLFDRNRRRRELELHQPANGQQALALFVDGLRVGGIVFRDIAANCVLQLRHRLRCPRMVLTANAVGIVAANIQKITI